MCARWRLIGGMVCAGCLTLGTVEGVSAQKKEDVVKAFAGTWRAPEFKMERDSGLDDQVFGAHASDVFRPVRAVIEVDLVGEYRAISVPIALVNRGSEAVEGAADGQFVRWIGRARRHRSHLRAGRVTVPPIL